MHVRQVSGGASQLCWQSSAGVCCVPHVAASGERHGARGESIRCAQVVVPVTSVSQMCSVPNRLHLAVPVLLLPEWCFRAEMCRRHASAMHAQGRATPHAANDFLSKSFRAPSRLALTPVGHSGSRGLRHLRLTPNHAPVRCRGDDAAHELPLGGRSGEQDPRRKGDRRSAKTPLLASPRFAAKSAARPERGRRTRSPPARSLRAHRDPQSRAVAEMDVLSPSQA